MSHWPHTPASQPPNLPGSQCRRLPMSRCHNIPANSFLSHFMSQCPSHPIFQCRNVSMFNVPESQCPNVPVSNLPVSQHPSFPNVNVLMSQPLMPQFCNPPIYHSQCPVFQAPVSQRRIIAVPMSQCCRTPYPNVTMSQLHFPNPQTPIVPVSQHVSSHCPNGLPQFLNVVASQFSNAPMFHFRIIPVSQCVGSHCFGIPVSICWAK